MNELVSNAYKHAFKDRQDGVITLRMLTKISGETELIVTDNGRGLPDGFDPTHANNMGLQIVQMLVNQLKGEISFASKDGTKVRISVFETEKITGDRVSGSA